MLCNTSVNNVIFEKQRFNIAAGAYCANEHFWTRDKPVSYLHTVHGILIWIAIL